MSNTLMLFFFVGFTMEIYEAQPLPGKPTDIRVLADSFNIGVQWEAPSETFGTIRNYVVRYAVLPNTTETSIIVGGLDSVSIIPVGSHVGRLFRIRVGAQNEAGVGPYSNVRYIRINCSGTREIYPNTSLTLRTLGFQSRDTVEPGVICSWRLKTSMHYVVAVKMEYVELVRNKTVPTGVNCHRSTSYVDVEGIGRYCDENDIDVTPRTSNQSEMSVTLRTGMAAGGRGFELKAWSVIRLPGPPGNVHVDVKDHAVIVTWQQPMGTDTLPVTSYVLRYGVLRGGHVYRLAIGPAMRRFSLNVDAFQGRLLSITLSAAIGDQEGDQTNPIYFRAPCRHTLHIEPETNINITSPNYPDPYPENFLCTWEVTTEPDVTLTVTFIDFRLEDTPSCGDYLRFTIEGYGAPECSRELTEKTIGTNSSSLNVTFVSNERNQCEGFFIRINAEGKTITTWPPFSALDTNQSFTNSISVPTQRLPNIANELKPFSYSTTTTNTGTDTLTPSTQPPFRPGEPSQNTDPKSTINNQSSAHEQLTEPAGVGKGDASIYTHTQGYANQTQDFTGLPHSHGITQNRESSLPETNPLAGTNWLERVTSPSKDVNGAIVTLETKIPLAGTAWFERVTPASKDVASTLVSKPSLAKAATTVTTHWFDDKQTLGTPSGVVQQVTPNTEPIPDGKALTQTAGLRFQEVTTGEGKVHGDKDSVETTASSIKEEFVTGNELIDVANIATPSGVLQGTHVAENNFEYMTRATGVPTRDPINTEASRRTDYYRKTAETVTENVFSTVDNVNRIPTMTMLHESSSTLTNSLRRPGGFEAQRDISGPVRQSTPGIIAGCVTTCIVMLLISVGLYRYRRRRLKMRVDVDRSRPYRHGHVELHDIIQQRRHSKQSNSYETFGVTDVTETSLTSTKGGKSVTTGNKQVKLSTRGVSRMRSCPDFTKTAKVQSSIGKTLSAFKFIEDRAMLETQIRRKQRRKRTTSL